MFMYKLEMVKAYMGIRLPDELMSLPTPCICIQLAIPTISLASTWENIREGSGSGSSSNYTCKFIGYYSMQRDIPIVGYD